MINILYVEDEPSLAMIVADSLEANGFQVVHCNNGEEALESFSIAKPDIMVVDVMMPVMDGFTLAAKIREMDTLLPIIFLTAKVQTEDVVRGFRLGGDDYVKKPFKIEELVVRIESLLKNSPKMLFGQKLMIGDYTLDSLKHQLIYQDEMLKLSFRESELLRKLYEQKDKVIPREEIMRA